jgi:hypothetical protein
MITTSDGVPARVRKSRCRSVSVRLPRNVHSAARFVSRAGPTGILGSRPWLPQPSEAASSLQPKPAIDSKPEPRRVVPSNAFRRCCTTRDRSGSNLSSDSSGSVATAVAIVPVPDG